MICERLQVIDWRLWELIEKGNTASGSMSNGDCASGGVPKGLKMWK
jgi:hypothetical protein